MQLARNQRNNDRSPATASPQKITPRTARPSLAIFCGLAVAVLVSFTPFAHASSGAISSPYKYAWSNVGGWVNFAPTNSTVTVTDSALTGYVWSVNDGWINLSPTHGGVTNSGGTLGGFAWDQSAGWVDFAGVTIDSAGKFHGQATGANGYVINFSCTNCDVRTDWRASAPAAVPGSPGAISPVFVPPFLLPASEKAPSAVEPPAGARPPASVPVPSKTGHAPPTTLLPGGAAYTPGTTFLKTGTSAPAYGHAPVPARAASGTTASPSSSISKYVSQFFKTAGVSLGAVVSSIKTLFVSFWKFFFR